MINHEIQNKYIHLLNLILDPVDYNKLDESCNSLDNEYAREILSRLDDAFVESHGVDYGTYVPHIHP